MGPNSIPQKVAWLPPLVSDMHLDAKSTGFGFSLERIRNMPIFIGVGLFDIRLNMGAQVLTGPDSPEPVGTFESWDRIKGTTISVGFEYCVRAAFGYTHKAIESHLAPMALEPGPYHAPKPNAHDLGMILQVPVMDLLKHTALIGDSGIFKTIGPHCDFGFFYSKTNIGGKVSYVDAGQSDPLPRNLSLGFHLSCGLAYKTGRGDFSLFSFKWSREVDDLLVVRHPDGSSEYATGLHHIRFFKDLIGGKTNPDVLSKRGYELGFYDFYFVRKGRYEDPEGQVWYDTEGYGINYTEPLKILAALLHADEPFLVRLLSCIRFERHHSTYRGFKEWSPLVGTEFESYVIRLENLVF